MKELGYTCDKGVWTSSPEAVAHLAGVADGMHALIVRRAGELDACTEGSPEEAEYVALIGAIDLRNDALVDRQNSRRQRLIAGLFALAEVILGVEWPPKASSATTLGRYLATMWIPRHRGAPEYNRWQLVVWQGTALLLFSLAVSFFFQGAGR